MRKRVNLFHKICEKELFEHVDIKYHILFYSKSTLGNYLCKNYYDAMNACTCESADISYELYRVEKVEVEKHNNIMNYMIKSDKGNINISLKYDSDDDCDVDDGINDDYYEIMINMENEKTLIFYQKYFGEKIK
jgi:hypothetical protein